MRPDLISASFTMPYFGKYSFIVHNCFSLLDLHANSHISKDFININQQNISAGSCKSNKHRKTNSLAQSRIKSSQTHEQNLGLSSPTVSQSSSRATAPVLLTPDNPASVALLGTQHGHQGTAPILGTVAASPVRTEHFPACCTPATGFFLVLTTAVRPRVKDGSFPLPSNSLYHSVHYTEDLGNLYALRVSNYRL